MEQEYTIGTGMKIFYGILSVGLFIFSFFLFSLGEGHSQTPAIFLLPVAVFSTSILIFINLIKRKVIVTDDSITNINVFSRKELLIKEIKGCRIGQKFISLEPVSSNSPKITIGNYNDLGDSDLLESWIKANFKDLDSIDIKFDKESILQNSELGATEADREATLKKAKAIATAYNIIGVALGLGMIFFETKWSIVLLLFYPLLAIIVMLFSKGLIKFLSNSKRSVYGSLMVGFFMPALMMLFKSIDAYSLFSTNNIWLPFLLISAIVFYLLYAFGINKSAEAVKGQVIFMLIMALIYGYGSTMRINCAFDNSIPQVFSAKVLDHEVEHGKHTSYYLTLSPWGPMQGIKEVEINGWLYDHATINDTVKVNFSQGLLHIPWFTVTKN